MNSNILHVFKLGDTVTYNGYEYRVQNDRGNKHIVVRINGERKKITVKELKWDVFSFYVLSGLVFSHPCRVMGWWMEINL